MRTIELNGIWKFAVEQDVRYHQGYDYSVPSSLRYWDTVPVPGCWNCYREKYDLYEGVAWFVREFLADDLPEKPVAVLYFEGVNNIADVFLNGQKIGSHEGGYTAFSMDVSNAVQKGHNRLAVRVDNRQHRMKFPPVLGWYNYGGIHRDVKLVISDKSQIREVSANAVPEGAGAVGQISVKAGPAPESMTAKARIIDPSGKIVWVGEAAGQGEWKFSFVLKEAKLWNPETPVLYKCEVEIYSKAAFLDRQSHAFGIRRLEVKGTKFMLNGKPLYLKGISYLLDHPVSGMTFDPRVVSADLDDLQAMGINCLRSHFPPPAFFMDECDRCGIMLWLEVPIYCLYPELSETKTPFSDPAYQALALNMLKEMVVHARNHPSVIIWSVGNECRADHAEALPFFRSCVDQVRALDKTRPIGYASLYGEIGCLADMVDIVGVNEYWGWYGRFDHFSDARQFAGQEINLAELEKCLDEKSKLGKPILITEFGADAAPGYLSSSCELWSEDYQSLFFKRQMEIFARYPAIAGVFPFVYADYRDPSKNLSQYWNGFNLKGVVDYHRRHKLGWETMQEFYVR